MILYMCVNKNVNKYSLRRVVLQNISVTWHIYLINKILDTHYSHRRIKKNRNKIFSCKTS